MGNRKDRKTISAEFKDLAGNLRKYIFCEVRMSAWEAAILSLNYARNGMRIRGAG